jgi:hypothetical protein
VSPMVVRVKWVLPLLLPLAAIAGCGTSGSVPPGAGQAASVNLTLNTVPIVRSVTISTSQRTFSNCQYGDPRRNTGSQQGLLGYPNGVCWLGLTNPFGNFPIKITNTGIASFMLVNGANAVPAEPGGSDNPWSLCNVGNDPAVDCKGRHGKPGADQYLLQNFGPSGRINASGLTTTPACDHEFDPSGRCWAVQGTDRTEGVELMGPSMSTDTSTKWTVTITWIPVPGQS